MVDNYRTHKYANVTKWLARPGNVRIQLHFTPTGAPGSISSRCVLFHPHTQGDSPGKLASVRELTTAIHNFIASYNEDC